MKARTTHLRIAIFYEHEILARSNVPHTFHTISRPHVTYTSARIPKVQYEECCAEKNENRAPMVYGPTARSNDADDCATPWVSPTTMPRIHITDGGIYHRWRHVHSHTNAHTTHAHKAHHPRF